MNVGLALRRWRGSLPSTISTLSVPMPVATTEMRRPRWMPVDGVELAVAPLDLDLVEHRRDAVAFGRGRREAGCSRPPRRGRGRCGTGDPCRAAMTSGSASGTPPPSVPPRPARGLRGTIVTGEQARKSILVACPAPRQPSRSTAWFDRFVPSACRPSGAPCDETVFDQHLSAAILDEHLAVASATRERLLPAIARLADDHHRGLR